MKFSTTPCGKPCTSSSNIANWDMTWANRLSLPYLGQQKQETEDVVSQVAASIQMKVRDDSELRERMAREQSEQIAHAAQAIHERLQRGGKLIIFGNGGSATDANDWALDCVDPPAGYRQVAAVSLANGASQHHRRGQ